MIDPTTNRRTAQSRTRFDDWRRRPILAVLVGVVVLAVLATALVLISNANPDLGLTLQLGGLPRSNSTVPRNFRLWAVQPDGKLRFATAFFPARANAPASEVFTVAGPFVDHPEDRLQAQYFGALNINRQIQVGQNNDSNRFYDLFWVEHDPAAIAYGVDLVIQNPPYITPDDKDKTLRDIAMGAPQQTYYAQVIVAVAFPAGTTVRDVAYAIPAAGTNPVTEVMLKPYRRVGVGEWTIYYFDQTALTAASTVRIRYAPPSEPKPAPELNFWEVDQKR